MVPPVFADMGSILIGIEDLGFQAEIELYIENGRALVSVKEF